MIKHHTKTKVERRKTRIRSKISGTAKRPRLNVFRSNQHLHAQLIDDQAEETLMALSTINVKGKDLTKTQKAQKLGEKLAKQAKQEGIKQVTLDRGPYRYHGRIKAFTQAARKAGLEI